ncbi:MAG TPA: hypothetical protein VMU55_03650 [Solirubrobacteraceae bacterium]|nr:hypothetical protein [Solirubrobacteraceae bacterium]
MTLTISLSSSSIASRPRTPNQVGRRSVRAEHARCETRHDLLGRYIDAQGHPRVVVALAGAKGSLLVVDRDASTLGDRRLVAHLASDEPAQNAALVCSLYLQGSEGRIARCVTPEDLRTVPFAGAEEVQEIQLTATAPPGGVELAGRDGCGYRLQLLAGDRCSHRLRWCECSADWKECSGPQPVSVREVIASLESYEPVRGLTVRAIAAYRDDGQVSVAMLGSELERVDRSPLVLNRGLREATLSVLEHEGSSMSEIAMRCGRIKRDCRGRCSGETSWLARRLGILPAAGESTPTPWVHSDVLGLIAREGLRISPREVELG